MIGSRIAWKTACCGNAAAVDASTSHSERFWVVLMIVYERRKLGMRADLPGDNIEPCDVYILHLSGRAPPYDSCHDVEIADSEAFSRVARVREHFSKARLIDL